ncbi:MAG: DUF1850 domain-containing protein [Rubrivivax sp.]|nr:DUF1850 domain-containing protein [Rubrivivax sp.]
MTGRRPAGAAVAPAARLAVLLATQLGGPPAASGAPAAACELVALEHRSGREVLRVPLAAASEAPELRLGFVHSVLGTPVEDRYRWHRGAWLLVEERFEGQGYGLPHAAGPGERLERTPTGWRLQLARTVHPIVVRPLPAQRMRLALADGRTWLLGGLTTQAVELRAEGCRADGG